MTVGGSGTSSLTLLAGVSHVVVVDRTMVNIHHTASVMKTPETLQQFRVLQPAGKNNTERWMQFNRRSAEPVGWDVTWEHGDQHIVCPDWKAAEAFAAMQHQSIRLFEAIHVDPDGSERLVTNIPSRRG